MINPSKGFAYNFNNNCYAIPLTTGRGATELGDLNALYDQIYYQIAPGYELILLGTFPNARFMSATAYDDHLAVNAHLYDREIKPQSPTMVNPYVPGANYLPNQTYGITVLFGGGLPVSVSPGCQTTPAIDQNVLDASQIHLGLSWDGYPNLPSYFPQHETGANASGVLQVRKYVNISASRTEVAIVRRLSDGCALPADQALSLNILNPKPASSWLHQTQINAHQDFAINVKPNLCFAADPANKVVWFRSRDYVPLDNVGAAGLQGTIQVGWIQSLLAGQILMRVQFQLPTYPAIPCPTGGCTLTGQENIRYFSLSFQAGSNTLLSIKDSDLVRDPQGNVTLIVSMGAVPPPGITPDNYYTYVDLTKLPNYNNLQTLFLRNILPNPTFKCSTGNVPYYTMEYNPEGGYMGNYVLTVDYPTPASLPARPIPPVRPDSCSLIPTEGPTPCP